MQFIQHCWVSFEYITHNICFVTMTIKLKTKKKEEKKCNMRYPLHSTVRRDVLLRKEKGKLI